MKPENPQQVASGVDDKTKTRKRDKRDKKDRKKQPSTMGSIFNTFLFLLAFEIGLYGCVFHQVSQNNIEGIFWTALGMACFLGIVQLIFILFVQNVSKKDVKSKSIKRLLIIGILIIPIVIFVASCVFTVGVTEILLNLTSIDSYLIPTNWNSNEAHLLYSRTVFFLVSSVCCLKLFLAQLEQLCIRFVHKKLSHVVFMIEFQDSTVPVQTVGGQNEVQAAYVMGGTGVGHDNNNNNNDHDHHPTQLLNQGHLQTQSHPTYTVLIMIASEIALAILQVLSANDGVFLSSFLPIFGLTCCALGVMVCYLILMNDWGSEDFSSLVSIWVSVPLTILLINTWCFSIQLIEFFMSTQGVWMLNGMFTQVSGVKLALLICMTVFYFFIVVSGIYGTKTLLEMIQIADGKEKERTSSFVLLKSESQKVVPSNPQNNTNVVVTTTTTQAIQPGSVAAMVAAHNNNNQPIAQKVGSNQ